MTLLLLILLLAAIGALVEAAVPVLVFGLLLVRVCVHLAREYLQQV